MPGILFGPFPDRKFACILVINTKIWNISLPVILCLSFAH
jgi:hypothetical protein